MSLCPYCETQVSVVDVEEVQLSTNSLSSFKGLSYACPKCQKILTISVSPVAHEEETAAALNKN